MTILKTVESPDRVIAEQRVNELVEQYEKQGYEAQVLNLTPTTHLEKIFWRFLVLFTMPVTTYLGGPPPDES